MNAQLKYADKRGSICAVIQGSNEREKGEVAIRDLVLGAELAASTKDRADYLELRAKAQFTVPEAGLVAAVREVLARHLTEASGRRDARLTRASSPKPPVWMAGSSPAMTVRRGWPNLSASLRRFCHSCLGGERGERIDPVKDAERRLAPARAKLASLTGSIRLATLAAER